MGRARFLLLALVLLTVLAACRDEPEEAATPAPTLDPVDTEPADPADTPTPEPTPETPEPTPEVDTPPPATYEVQPGDTLSTIAAQFDTTVDALVEANDIDDPDRILVGDVLTIPQDGQPSP